MKRLRAWARRDDGAALVEFAFVGPILFFLLIGMLDIGLTVLGKAVASGAARDGARVGIIHFDDADNTSGPNHQLVVDAVEAKLTGHIASSPVVTVSCLDGGTKVPKPAGCDRDTIRVDYDLMQVTVRWRSIAIDAFNLIPTDHTDQARMVITGDGLSSGADAPIDCDAAVHLAFTTAAPSPIQELDADVPSTLTIARTGPDLDCWSQVTYSTGGGNATPDVDYVSESLLVVVFPPGLASEVIPIVVKGDDTGEPTETFGVTLTASTGGTIVAPATATVTILDDDGPPPALGSLQLFDVNANGRVDRVVATFDQNLDASCPTPGAFVLTNTPSGGSRGAVTVAGTTATIDVVEGGGAPDTAGSGFQVRLDPGCVTASGSGAAASFASTAAADRARPVLLGVTDTDGLTNGRAEAGDTLTFTFSEAMAAAASPTVVTEGPGTAGQLSINGLITTTPLNPANNTNVYAVTTDVVFGNSPVVTTGAQVSVTLAPCTSGCANVRTGQSSNTGITFFASSSLADPVGNLATGSTSLPTSGTPSRARLF